MRTLDLRLIVYSCAPFSPPPLLRPPFLPRFADDRVAELLAVTIGQPLDEHDDFYDRNAIRVGHKLNVWQRDLLS